MPNCNSQVIILFHFILSSLRLQLGLPNVIVRSLFALICFVCLHACVFTCLLVFLGSLHLDIMLTCYVLLCVFLLLLCLYDLFDYNKMHDITTLVQRQLGPFVPIFHQSNASEDLQTWASPTLDPQGPSTRQIMLV